MIHTLKILPEFFKQVKSGKKTFEIRKNDRDYKVGDILVLYEINDNEFISPCVSKEVIFVLSYKDFPEGIKEGYVIMSIK